MEPQLCGLFHFRSSLFCSILQLWHLQKQWHIAVLYLVLLLYVIPLYKFTGFYKLSIGFRSFGCFMSLIFKISAAVSIFCTSILVHIDMAFLGLCLVIEKLVIMYAWVIFTRYYQMVFQHGYTNMLFHLHRIRFLFDSHPF